MTKHETKAADTVGPRGRLYMAWRLVALGGFCILLFSACAHSPATRDREIQQRAQERWDALLAGDYERAYSYASPGYRSSISATDFEITMRMRRVQYTAAEYKRHSCEEAACTVEIFINYRVVRPLPGVPEWNSTSLIDETWVHVDGKWWYLPDS